MTVRELIEELSKHDPDREIAVFDSEYDSEGWVIEEIESVDEWTFVRIKPVFADAETSQ